MTRFFVTSSGTGIGKTLITAALIHQVKAAGTVARGIKPVLSGYPPDDDELADCDVILSAMGEKGLSVKAVSPWRFTAPLSPDMAAQRENRHIRLDDIVEFCNQATEQPGIHFVEGVGGVLVPLNERHTVLDWIEALAAPTILVVGSYLGAMSHALTAYSVLRHAGVAVAGLVVSESAESTVELGDTCVSLRRFVDVPVFPVPRIPGSEPWRHLPPLLSLLDRDAE